ncbi:CLIP domain-containing serine protease B15-like [Armigeres subalbatus]|uniref:CLIP domain-containing serine protease B15-like n=2 Tax=Armigeres subalbatus TaxID=124917 RepID=UPI002ED13D6D
MLSVVQLFLLSLGICLVRSELNETCTTSSNRIGRCLAPRECQHVIDILRSDRNTHEDYHFIDHNKCGQTSDSPPKPLVCCPVIQNVAGCGVPKLANRIFGGEETGVGMFPWAGVIQYRVSKRRFSIYCGAALVHHRWALTAAHCIISIPRSWSIHRVRFNEWDTTRKANCTIKNDIQICRAEYEIEDSFSHPLYLVNNPNMRHDIGLLKTKLNVLINDYVIPICLPFSEIIRQLPIAQEEFVVTGWGQTDQGTPGIQRHVVLIGQNKSICDEAFGSQKIELTEDQLCIGGSEGQDSCRGDSGGPLTRAHGLVNYLVGVVSFGAYKCGSKNHPGVYTNVGNYLDWIEETIVTNSA